MKKQKKKLVVLLLALCLCGIACGGRNLLYAQNVDVAIRQDIDVSSCRGGDTVTLSVYLDGGSRSISGMDGYVEYDANLFFVDSISLVTVGNATDVGFASGYFNVRYPSELTVSDGGLLLQLRLRVKEGVAAGGKTTICVTELELDGSSGRVKLANHVPSSVEIMADPNALTAADDWEADNGDWMEDAEDWDEYWDEDTEEVWDDPEEDPDDYEDGEGFEVIVGDTEDEEPDQVIEKPGKDKGKGGKNTADDKKGNANQSVKQKPVSSVKKPYKTGEGDFDFLVAGAVLLSVGTILLLARRKIGSKGGAYDV